MTRIKTMVTIEKEGKTSNPNFTMTKLQKVLGMCNVRIRFLCNLLRYKSLTPFAMWEFFWFGHVWSFAKITVARRNFALIGVLCTIHNSWMTYKTIRNHNVVRRVILERNVRKWPLCDLGTTAPKVKYESHLCLRLISRFFVNKYWTFINNTIAKVK